MNRIPSAPTVRGLFVLALLIVSLAACGGGAQTPAAGGADQHSESASVPATGAETAATAAAQTETSPGSSTWPVGGTPMSPSATAGSATAASATPAPANLAR